ncbi:dihydropteroate synthase [Heliobacillus mobilis]|uniref:Dihydropteroate synthase n=1 Tax=Heliobacterium mobile TaxID=28064 RepID=A0A6I3SI50_HELMO|nr:dihydropteroate synthase [Heliobacterium mobile]MTV48510.1 dihydropteroate synthase [Heliobacterium mobile]
MGPVQVLEIQDKKELAAYIAATGCDPAGTAIMTAKGSYRVLRVTGVSAKGANLLKQEMLARGGDCAVHRLTCVLDIDKTDVILMGTDRQYGDLCRKLQIQPFGLKKLGQEILATLEKVERRQSYRLDCRGKSLPIGERTLIMGILNLTPDSFSDGGSYPTVREALRRVEEMVQEGADIIDIGAESTRPGHRALTAEEEMERLLPFLREIVPHCPVPISVDTYKAATAKQALEAGAHILNDIWGLQRDPEMAAVAAAYSAPVIVMHNQEGTDYNDLMGDMLTFLQGSIDRAREAGVPQEAIIIDPGIGFGKTYDHNLEVMHRLGELKVLGQPILLGTSRKSIIAKTLNLPVDERLEGTLATTALGIAKGVDIVRVHDVLANARTAKMTDAMVRLPLKRE